MFACHCRAPSRRPVRPLRDLVGSAVRTTNVHWPTRPGVTAALAVTVALLCGCSLTPKGMKEEQARLAALSDRYEPPFEERVLPELPAQPTWQDVLHRAFLANGELE